MTERCLTARCSRRRLDHRAAAAEREPLGRRGVDFAVLGSTVLDLVA